MQVKTDYCAWMYEEDELEDYVLINYEDCMKFATVPLEKNGELRFDIVLLNTRFFFNRT